MYALIEIIGTVIANFIKSFHVFGYAVLILLIVKQLFF